MSPRSHICIKKKLWAGCGHYGSEQKSSVILQIKEVPLTYYDLQVTSLIDAGRLQVGLEQCWPCVSGSGHNPTWCDLLPLPHPLHWPARRVQLVNEVEDPGGMTGTVWLKEGL